MRNAVHARFVDMSTSVREAAVELIGRFVLNKPELTHQYYDMLIERILVSVLQNRTTLMVIVFLMFKVTLCLIKIYSLVILRNVRNFENDFVGNQSNCSNLQLIF